MKKNLVFIHGLESTAQGTKGQYFQEHFPEMIVENFTGDFIERMNKLNDLLSLKDNLVIVGSSYGGTMAVQYAANNEKKMKKLILLAPALNLPELKIPQKKVLTVPVIIYHGTKDDVVNPIAVQDIAQKIFTNLEHHLVDDDHSLHITFPLLKWSDLLEIDNF
jgi:pimeloyl-ACP methyl ester carboxylesterase